MNKVVPHDKVMEEAMALAAVRQGQVQIRYLDYDWALNDAKR